MRGQALLTSCSPTIVILPSLPSALRLLCLFLVEGERKGNRMFILLGN